MTHRRKSNSIDKRIPCNDLPGRRVSQSSSTSSGAASTPFSSGVSRNNDESELLSHPRHSSDRTPFNDPGLVQQWVATSTTGSLHPLGNFPQIMSTSNQRMDACNDTSSDLGHTVYCSAMQSSASAFSLLNHTGSCEYSIEKAIQPDLCTSGAGIATTMVTGSTFPLDAGRIEIQSAGDIPPYDTWPEAPPFDMPISAEFSHAASSRSYHYMDPDFQDDIQLWPQMQFPGQESTSECPDLYSSHHLPLSSPSAVSMDPSLSSSYSQCSFPLQQTGSPTSFASLEESNPLDPLEEYGVSPFSIGVPAQHLYPSGPYEQWDPSSTLRQSHIPQRPTLSQVSPWPVSESIPLQRIRTSYVDPCVPRRQGGDSESGSARRDELYQVGPKDDGLYHCPFEITEGCTHKPEKLKCNYDKHLDSHLKPYRCKVPSCVSVPFSSTACLLRHEREAHGMHGHGEKPYLCTNGDCERSIHGNGFPRRWNLQDHMKRVHDYTSPASNGSISPTHSIGSYDQGKYTLPLRKRRTSNTSQVSQPKRAKSTVNTKINPKVNKGQSSNNQGKQRRSMQRQWQEQHATIKEHLEFLDPTDIFGHQQIKAEYTLLNDINLNLHQLENGQYSSCE